MKPTSVQPYIDRLNKCRDNPGIQPSVKKTMTNNIISEMIRGSKRTSIAHGIRAVQFIDGSGALIGPDPNNPGEVAVVSGNAERMKAVVAKYFGGN